MESTCEVRFLCQPDVSWYPVRKAPDGEGSETYDHWEMRVHKRLLEMDISTSKDQTALRSVTKIPIPDTVSIEISMRNIN